MKSRRNTPGDLELTVKLVEEVVDHDRVAQMTLRAPLPSLKLPNFVVDPQEATIKLQDALEMKTSILKIS